MAFDVDLRSHRDTSGDGGLDVGIYTVDRSVLVDYVDQIAANDITFHLPIKDLDGLNHELNKIVYQLFQSDEAIAAASDDIPLSYLSTDGTLAANSDVKVSTQKAVKTYVDTGLALKMPLSYLSTDGTLASNSDLKLPTEQAVKTYVDARVQGLSVKGAVKVATTANITLSGTQTIDGVSVGVGDRVLVKNQTTGSENGIYVCASGSWSRATDADVSAEVVAGMFTFSTQGTTNADIGWVLTTDNPITLGTTALTFTQFSTLAAPLSTDSIYGRTRLSFAAASGSDPIAVGANDPTWRSLSRTYHLEKDAHTSAGLSAAMTAIGTSNQVDLVISTNLTITTSVNMTGYSNIHLKFTAGGKVTVSGSSTLTIASMEDHPHRQIFFGVDASNHVVFAANAVSRYKLTWYMGIVSTANCSYAVDDIHTSATTAAGGIGEIIPGSWKVSARTLPSHFEWHGFGQGTDSGGCRFIANSGSDAYVFRSYRSFRNNGFCNLTISTEGYTTTECWRIEGQSGYSGQGLSARNVTFYSNGAVASSAPPQVNHIDTMSGALFEVVRGYFENCHFISVDGSKGFYSESINTQWTFNTCEFQVGKGDSYGIFAYRCGYLEVLNCDFRGQSASYSDTGGTIGTITCTGTSGTTALTATSGSVFTRQMIGSRVVQGGNMDRYIIKVIDSTHATLSGTISVSFTNASVTVYKWTNNTNRAGACILVGDINTVNIESSQEEGFNYFLKIIGLGYDRSINLTANNIQDQIEIAGSCCLYMRGNVRYSNCFADTSGTVAFIHSDDNVKPQLYCSLAVTLSEANNWGHSHAGTSIFKSDLGVTSGIYQQIFGYHTKFIETTASALTRPVLEVVSTYDVNGAAGQRLLQLGIADSVNLNFKYGWYAIRNSDTGYLHWTGTQDQGYNGWAMEMPVGYGPTVRGVITQTGSRSTTVVLNALHGVITTYGSSSIPPGGFVTFQMTNSWILNSDQVEVNIVDGATNQSTFAQSSRAGGGFCYITIFNFSTTTAESGTHKIKFRVKKDGGQTGISL